jgi:hypothetical protein
MTAAAFRLASGLWAASGVIIHINSYRCRRPSCVSIINTLGEADSRRINERECVVDLNPPLARLTVV